jgi:hypothetical protein
VLGILLLLPILFWELPIFLGSSKVPPFDPFHPWVEPDIAASREPVGSVSQLIQDTIER